VEVDSGQLSQVIQNLVLNAVQAMPGGGKLTIVAENKVLEEANWVGLTPGNYVKFQVQDTGSGILPENLLKIFDPYFSTKEVGSGLGLAVCYLIIKKHEGHILVESSSDKGSTFCVYLPALIPITSNPLPIIMKQNSGKGRILVMDDEEVIRNVTQEILGIMGYTVETVKNGEEALKYYHEALTLGQPYDLVILDLTIPGGMGGKPVMTHLLEIGPQVKAIVSSGYSDDPVMATYREYGFVAVLRKPYQFEELAGVLKHAFN
jgi:CheY-like chemotaxis protein